MELAADKPWMFVTRQFDDLHELAIARGATENQSALLQSFSILGIEFVTMAMALANLFRAAVNLPCQRAFSQQTRPGAQAHRAAHFLDVNQITEFEYDCVRRFDIEFG